MTSDLWLIWEKRGEKFCHRRSLAFTKKVISSASPKIVTCHWKNEFISFHFNACDEIRGFYRVPINPRWSFGDYFSGQWTINRVWGCLTCDLVGRMELSNTTRSAFGRLANAPNQTVSHCPPPQKKKTTKNKTLGFCNHLRSWARQLSDCYKRRIFSARIEMGKEVTDEGRGHVGFLDFHWFTFPRRLWQFHKRRGRELSISRPLIAMWNQHPSTRNTVYFLHSPFICL